MKKVIYTCITGNYDSLKIPQFYNPDWTYVCFTDNPNLKSRIWNIKEIPQKIKNLDLSRQNRYIKIMAHELFPEYDFSIYIDGTMRPTNNLTEFQSIYCNEIFPLYLIPHAKRNCIYQEFFACAEQHKDNIQIMYEQSKKYHEEGFPYNYGLSHNCMLYRYHNNPICIEIMENLLDMILNYSLRDQLSMFYVLWKTKNIDNIKMLDRDIIYNYFDYQNSWYHDFNKN